MAAIKALDHDNDDLWTESGLPKLSAVEEVYGAAGLTREDVELVSPGWNREKSLAAALDSVL